MRSNSENLLTGFLGSAGSNEEMRENVVKYICIYPTSSHVCSVFSDGSKSRFKFMFMGGNYNSTQYTIFMTLKLTVHILQGNLW